MGDWPLTPLPRSRGRAAGRKSPQAFPTARPSGMRRRQLRLELADNKELAYFDRYVWPAGEEVPTQHFRTWTDAQIVAHVRNTVEEWRRRRDHGTGAE